MWSSTIWIYLEMYSGIICIWWCMKEVLYFSVTSSNKLNYWFKIVWVSQIFLYQQPCNSKKAFGNKAICSYHRNSFQTSVYHLLRLLKANLLETTSLWCCICKCLLALQVGWSPNVPALLTYSVSHYERWKGGTCFTISSISTIVEIKLRMWSFLLFTTSPSQVWTQSAFYIKLNRIGYHLC